MPDGNRIYDGPGMGEDDGADAWAELHEAAGDPPEDETNSPAPSEV